MASTNNHRTPDPQAEPRSTGPRRYPAEYRARILAGYGRLGRQGKGALLRREGLYASLITAWRQQRDRGAKTALAAPAGRPKADPRDKEIARLGAQVARLETELGKARTVIEVQGKLSALPGRHGQRQEQVSIPTDTTRVWIRLAARSSRTPVLGPWRT